MKLQVARQIVECCAECLRGFKVQFSKDYDVQRQWGSQSDPGIPYSERNGVYFDVSRDGDILYVGKADREKPGGIGNEVCRWLRRKKPSAGIMFPRHKWQRAKSVSEQLKRLVAAGSFVIVSTHITPSSQAEPVEKLVTCLSKILDGRPPPLNLRG